MKTKDKLTNGIAAVIFIIAIVYVVNFIIRAIHANKVMVSKIPQIATYSTLLDIASECDKYEAENGRWPNSLSELQKGPPVYPSEYCTDAWGRMVIFVPFTNSPGYGKAISYGSDGKPGGTGLDRDFEIRFPLAANKNWNDQQGDWLKSRH